MNENNQQGAEIGISLLEKNGEKLLQAVEAGNVAGIVCGSEIMYFFIDDEKYQCFIHAFGGEEGRHKAFDMDSTNREMFKGLEKSAEQMFSISHGDITDYMGIMVTAEEGIVSFLRSIGKMPNMPSDDKIDFTVPKDDPFVPQERPE